MTAVLVATNYTVDLPGRICEGFPNPRAALRTLLIEALDRGLEPDYAKTTDEMVRVSLYLATGVETRVRQIAGYNGRPFNEVVSGLARSRASQKQSASSEATIVHKAPEEKRSADDHRTTPPSAASEPAALRPPYDSRDALQSRLLVPLLAGINAGKIVFAEGGTGLGKSRIIARCALEYLQTNKEAKVLILAPTVAVLSHLVQEFRQVAPPDFDASSVVLGRGQFVSYRRLSSLLSTVVPDPALNQAWEAARQWLESGGPSASHPGHRSALGFSACWLADALRRAAPAFPVDDVLLGGSEEEAEDPAQTVYQDLRLRAFESEVRIIFATQAMACLNVWSHLRPDRQKGILPPCSLILIDEAHELEEVMARTIGSSISLLHMRQVLRQGFDHSLWSELQLTAAAEQTLKYLDQAEHILRQFPSAGLISSWSESKNDERQQPFATFLTVARSLNAALAPFTRVQNHGDAGKFPLRLFREWHLSFEQMLGSRQNVWVDFSPVVRTPRLTVGPSQLVRPFEEFWSSCDAAGLLSGTLYLPNADGRLSSGFLRMKLLVPRERAHEINPVHPSWNHTIPTVHLPSAAAAHTLLYPGSADDGKGATDVQKWHHTVATKLQEIAGTAAGGTLVLCCSYLDVRALGALLAGDLADRLLTSHNSSSLRTLSDCFVELGRKGARPVWLATGGAWTGLDLSGPATSDPAEDLTLTDLVITRVPFGANKTAVHLARTKRLGFDVECMEAALRLKQGLGRLIRRAGVNQRRIWMLDGRSCLQHSGYFRRVFGPVFIYPNRYFFD
ncbi:MAG: DEAD/DEAH box helicase family protein [Rhodospirillales bacterium]|nr:DEAD/DEAH box helicase family protein [Acetobacter sp.]